MSLGSSATKWQTSLLLSRSREWQQVSDKEKKRIGLEFEDDGEFW